MADAVGAFVVHEVEDGIISSVWTRCDCCNCRRGMAAALHEAADRILAALESGGAALN
jgi:hypothetical protein